MLPRRRKLTSCYSKESTVIHRTRSLKQRKTKASMKTGNTKWWKSMRCRGIILSLEQNFMNRGRKKSKKSSISGNKTLKSENVAVCPQRFMKRKKKISMLWRMLTNSAIQKSWKVITEQLISHGKSIPTPSRTSCSLLCKDMRRISLRDGHTEKPIWPKFSWRYNSNKRRMKKKSQQWSAWESSKPTN